MPRKVATRKWIGTDAKPDAYVKAVRAYLIDHDFMRARDAIQAAGERSDVLILYLDYELADFWRLHREAVRREAHALGVVAWGEVFERWDGLGPEPAAVRA